MAMRFLLRRPAALPVTALTAALILTPKSSVHAESPRDASERRPRRSLYDDSLSAPVKFADSRPTHSENCDYIRPTDRLAAQIGAARVFLHGHAAALEDKTNEVLTRAFHLEHSFTSTIAGLAPGPQTGEQVMPGAIYVAVAAMGSSIMVRNRNVLLRGVVPMLVGLGAGYVVLPNTMRNVGELVWRYEERFPAVAETHLAVKERVTRFVQTGVAHSQMGVQMFEGKVGEARERIEQWVSKGK
ncbi:hypothetical protein EJ06DRAFT_582634 [Trichodelitschia bisporula]|uniref:MICOS complex subunit n=1 Tax=Trichodelitschia bisporula TaxID=703511 RepID=A0A6G1HW23_9PEZI|nr:hypothetical protein EJ06DRAFT_582634 [Trichodelitschia bisporula]